MAPVFLNDSRSSQTRSFHFCEDFRKHTEAYPFLRLCHKRPDDPSGARARHLSVDLTLLQRCSLVFGGLGVRLCFSRHFPVRVVNSGSTCIWSVGGRDLERLHALLVNGSDVLISSCSSVSSTFNPTFIHTAGCHRHRITTHSPAFPLTVGSRVVVDTYYRRTPGKARAQFSDVIVEHEWTSTLPETVVRYQ